ncbi:MAG: hypothetical protein J07HQX50_00300 [Haloquadratum sp. J07HQX50]|nr:MAG: hypothetical protein J07HQX50_00300 [Haloquadratum sp. J07HQX50]
MFDLNVQPSADAVHKQGRAIPIKGVLPELVVDSTANSSKVRVHFRQSAPPTLYQRLAADELNTSRRTINRCLDHPERYGLGSKQEV